MPKHARRRVKIEKVMLRLRLQHGASTEQPLNVDTDVRKGHKSWTTTQFCSDPIEEWTCPLCMKEYNGYGLTVVVPCWVCRDKKPIEAFGSLWQEDLPEPQWSPSFVEQEAFEDYFDKRRQKESTAWLARQLRESDRALGELRKRGGASIKQVENLYAKRKKILDDHRKYERQSTRKWFPNYDPKEAGNA